MKNFLQLKWMLALLLISVTCSHLSAQNLKEVFSNTETPITYLGIDFTQARLINLSELPSDIRDRHYPAINDLIVNEPKKYDVAGAFNKSNINSDIGLVAKRNATINLEEMKSTNTADYNRLKSSDIDKLVSGFDFAGKKGIGLLFVMDGMSKANKGAGMWVTLVDMATKKVLLTEMIVGKTSIGFGFRNYWANPVEEVIKQIGKKKYKEWKASYGG